MTVASHLIADLLRIHAFWPDASSTVNINAGTSSGNVQVQSAATRRHCRILNEGTVTVYVELGIDNTVAATLPNGSTPGALPIPAGGCEIIAGNFTWAAAITRSGTALVNFTPGEGE